VRLVGSGHLKDSVMSPEIEPATFRFVAKLQRVLQISEQPNSLTMVFGVIFMYI
jgi:hypothetical protein